MRAVVQRVSGASVNVDGAAIGSIDHGLTVLICAMRGDGAVEATLMAGKIAKLRIFRDDAGRMNRSVLDAGGAVLAISQFTLAADTTRGNRPGFSTAADPAEGERLYTVFCDELRALGLAVETGQFGADMSVALTNDGPVTVMLDTENWRKGAATG